MKLVRIFLSLMPQRFVNQMGLALLTLILTGCAETAVANLSAEDKIPATAHPYFEWGSATPANPSVTPVPVSPDSTATVFYYFTHQEMPTPQPTATRRPTTTPRPSPTPEPTSEGEPGSAAGLTSNNGNGNVSDDFGQIIIFDDVLAEDWNLDESWDIAYDTNAGDFVHTGEKAISVSPEEDYGAVFFNITADTTYEYLTSDILAVSFWVNAGEEDLALSDMAVTVLGSNEYPYWREDDDSANPEGGDSPFSETRLYYLEFNRSLPAGEWIEVIIWIDDLIYDPNTTYITGLYIKNGEDYRGTFYVDDVSFLTLDS